MGEENIEDICCTTRKDIFEEIESRNIDVSDIVARDKYPEFKRLLLTDRVQCCPLIGRNPPKIYDLTKIDDYIAYTELINK